MLPQSSTRFGNYSLSRTYHEPLRSTSSALHHWNLSAPPSHHAAPRGRCYQGGWERFVWWHMEHGEKSTGLWLSAECRRCRHWKGSLRVIKFKDPSICPWSSEPTFWARNLCAFSWSLQEHRKLMEEEGPWHIVLVHYLKLHSSLFSSGQRSLFAWST